MEKIINVLKKFDLTESDSKVYLALHRNGPSTGYEVSKISGVSRSKVYNVLENLHSRGFVAMTQEDKSQLYRAEPIESIARHLQDEVEDNLEILVSSLNNIEGDQEEQKIWQLKGYDNVINKCLELIHKAEGEILIQIWAEELTGRIEEALVDQEQAIRDSLVIFYDLDGKYKTRVERFLKHGLENQKLNDIGSRWITLTIDSKEMFHASIKSEYMAEAIYTENTGMVFFAREYIKHDAYSLKLMDALGDQAKDVFGENQERLRNLFTI